MISKFNLLAWRVNWHKPKNDLFSYLVACGGIVGSKKGHLKIINPTKFSKSPKNSSNPFNILYNIIDSETLQLSLSKRDGIHQIMWSSLTLFFQENKRFPRDNDRRTLINFIQDVSDFLNITFQNNQEVLQKCLNDKCRTIRRFKQEIRFLFGFRLGTSIDQNEFIDHCKKVIFPIAPTWDQALEHAYIYFKNQKIEPYRETQLSRFLTTAHHQFEMEFFKRIKHSLSSETKLMLDNLLSTFNKSHHKDLKKSSEQAESYFTLTELKSEHVELKIDSILSEIQKYQYLKKINIPKGIELFGSRKLLCKYYDRVLAERPSSLKKHKPSIRYGYLSLFGIIRQQRIDLLLKLLRRILTKAERSVDRALLLDNKRVKGKLATLLFLAKQSIDYPDGVIKETIYPEISKDRLSDIITDLGEDGHWYRNQIKVKALSLYSHNNRRIVWHLINVLNFGADPQLSKILKAINFLKKMNADDTDKKTIYLKQRLYHPILLKNIIPLNWLPFVTIKTSHPSKMGINWNAFELALFERLETELPLKNIWVKNAFRYRWSLKI